MHCKSLVKKCTLRGQNLQFWHTKSAFISIYRIPLEAVFEEGSLPENAYKLVKDEKYCGEIKAALTFTPEVIRL